jgi:hypothetical protein
MDCPTSFTANVRLIRQTGIPMDFPTRSITSGIAEPAWQSPRFFDGVNP